MSLHQCTFFKSFNLFSAADDSKAVFGQQEQYNSQSFCRSPRGRIFKGCLQAAFFSSALFHAVSFLQRVISGCWLQLSVTLPVPTKQASQRHVRVLLPGTLFPPVCTHTLSLRLKLLCPTHPSPLNLIYFFGSQSENLCVN